MRVGILGLGLIGGSLLRRLAREEQLDVRGWDADAQVRASAAAAGFAMADSHSGLVADADLVFVALPPRATASAVLGALAADDHVVVADVASVKAPVLDAVRAGATPEALGRFVPAHPLAGAEATGWDASRADLLDDAVWAICPPAEDAPLEPVAAVASVLDRLGSRLVFCTADEHDTAVAVSSHAPHVVAQALAIAVDTPLAAVLSGGALRDGTRVAGANPDLWVDVLNTNAAATADALSLLIGVLERARTDLRSGTGADIAQLWHAASAFRRRIDACRWGDGPWTAQRLTPPALAPLLSHGRAARLIRGLVLENDEWRFELSSSPEPHGLV